MNIEALSETRLRITLDGKEVYELFGGYEKINYDDPLTRLVLHGIVKQALPDDSFLRSCRKLLIEVRPCSDGCTIDLIKNDIRKPTRLYPPKRWRLDFFDTESMLNALCALYRYKSRVGRESALYRTQSGYHAVVSATHKAIEAVRRYCLADSSPLAIAAIEEYAAAVCAENAVEMIGKAFIKDTFDPIS